MNFNEYFYKASLCIIVLAGILGCDLDSYNQTVVTVVNNSKYTVNALFVSPPGETPGFNPSFLIENIPPDGEKSYSLIHSYEFPEEEEGEYGYEFGIQKGGGIINYNPYKSIYIVKGRSYTIYCNYNN